MSTGVRATAWFLAIGYGIAAPVVAVLEYRAALFSSRFDVPASLVYVTAMVQFGCAIAIPVPRLASGAAVVLSVTSIGAMGAHLRIGSPLTALPAVLFTALQLWFAGATRQRTS